MKSFLLRHKKRATIILYSLLTATILLFVSYITTNTSFSISGEAGCIKLSNIILNNISDNEKNIPDSILFVNVSYDKQLADICDNDGFPIGNIDITNRSSLLRFLDILSHRNDYKYIILDIFFEDGIHTEYDSLLFDKIASMERIVIPFMRDDALAEKNILQTKAATSDYTTTFFSGSFCKFEIVNEGKHSLPYRIYHDVTGHQITSLGLFYYDNGNLCNHTLFARPFIIPKGIYAKDGSRNFYNMGSDLLSDENNLYTDNLLKDKYIFIGDMLLADEHETVIGNMQGIVILANTFISLMKQQHIIPFVVKITLFILFLIFSYHIYSCQSLLVKIINWENKRGRHPFSKLGFILSWINYSSILIVICLFFYYIYGVAYDIFITATILNAIDYIVTHSSQIKKHVSIMGRKTACIFKKQSKQ